MFYQHTNGGQHLSNYELVAIRPRLIGNALVYRTNTCVLAQVTLGGVYSCRCTFGRHCMYSTFGVTCYSSWYHVTTTVVRPGLPLKDRVLRSKLVTGNLVLSSPHGRPSEYKSYSHNQLHLALQAVSK